MIVVVGYIGGEIRQGQTGAEYSILPRITLSVTESTIFDDVKRQIYEFLGYSKEQYSLVVFARFDIGSPGPRFFLLIPLYEESGWQMIFQQTLARSSWRMIELYIDAKQIDNQGDEPRQNHVPQRVARGHNLSEVPNPPRARVSNPPRLPSPPILSSSPVEVHADVVGDMYVGGKAEIAVVRSSYVEHDSDRHPDRISDVDSNEPCAENIVDPAVVFSTEPRVVHSLRAFPLVGRSERRYVGSFHNMHMDCCAPANRFDHAQLTADIIADVIRHELKDDMDFSIKNVRKIVRQKFPNMRPSYNKLWRGREIAVYQLFGAWEGAYNILTPLLEAIKVANPGTKYELLSKPTTRADQRVFHCVAWAFGPCIEAIPHLRPVFCVDASHLSGRYKGRLLTACGYDADNKLMPIAFALVEMEDSDNWGWFMKWLRREIFGFGKFMCVISNRHKAIKWMFKQPHIRWNENAGECVHRLCSQHISENLYKECKNDDVIKTFESHIVKKKKPRRFEEGIKKIAETCPPAIAYLRNVGKYVENDKDEIERPCKVFQCMDQGYRWGIMTSNGSEALNNVFKHSRRLPVIAIVEDTFNKCLGWFDDRRSLALQHVNSGKKCSPKVEQILQKHSDKAARMHVTSYGDEGGEYHVKVKNEKVSVRQGGQTITLRKEFRYKVVMQENVLPTCECLKLNLVGIPCSHILAVCRFRNLDENKFVHPYYSAQILANTWAGRFHPYSYQTDWPVYNGPLIVPEPRLIKSVPWQKNRIPMDLDNLEERRLGYQACRSTRDKNLTGASSDCSSTNRR